MSAGEVQGDVKIVLTADDQATTTIDSATDQINAKFKEMNNVTRAGSREWETNNWQVYNLGRTMASTGRLVDRSIQIFNSYELMQIRIQQATQAAANADQAAADALAQYGQNSEQFARANEAAVKAHQAEKNAAREAEVQFALMVVSMVAQSGILIERVIPRLAALTASLGYATVGATALQRSLLGIGTIGAVATGAATAITAAPIASYLNKQFPNNPLAQVQRALTPGANQLTQGIRNFIFNITGFDINQVLNAASSILGVSTTGSGAP
jgi:energy-converting hydrogenase Eha subunit A